MIFPKILTELVVDTIVTECYNTVTIVTNITVYYSRQAVFHLKG